MNVEHILRSLSVDFDIGCLRATVSIPGAEVNSQGPRSNFLDYRKRSVRDHPVEVTIRRKDDTFLYPLHVRIQLEIQICAQHITFLRGISFIDSPGVCVFRYCSSHGDE